MTEILFKKKNYLMFQSLSESDRSSYEVEVLSTSMDAIKKKLSPVNRSVFESSVEVYKIFNYQTIFGFSSFTLFFSVFLLSQGFPHFTNLKNETLQ
jgi:hypothetical protein